MKRTTVHVLLAASLLLINVDHAWAWGRGGYAAGGYHSSTYTTSSYHASGAAAGGYRAGAVGGAAGGYRTGAVGGVKTESVGTVRTGEVGGVKVGAAGTVRAGEVGGVKVGAAGSVHAGEVSGYKAGAVGVAGGHATMTTDFGFSHVAGAAGASGYVAAGHHTVAYSSSVVAARGTAVRGGFYHYSAFNASWWGGHPTAWRPVGWTAATAWRWTTWPALTVWFGWTAAPVYYDFGTTIVYQGDQVYINNQPGPTAVVYYQEAADLALSAPAAPSPEKKGDEWNPLGVFALVQGDQTDPGAVFQLAVNKAGIIGGNYYNILTDTTLPVRGAVDKKTQRASWVVGDQKSTVYDTGIYNLTKDESPILIHFGKERTQQWLLVRVKEKDGQPPPPAAKDTELPPPVEAEKIAHVTVVVPADAEVYFDGVLTSLTGTERVFKTPTLEKGASYTYTVRGPLDGGRLAGRANPQGSGAGWEPSPR